MKTKHFLHTKLWLIKPLKDTTLHPSELAEARREMWVNCQGQKWSAPQGTNGKYLGSLSHMASTPKKHEHQSVETWAGSYITGKKKKGGGGEKFFF